jgi:uncharacterized protein YjgD (DUF1641 family)
MNDQDIQQGFDAINARLDVLIANVNEQRRKSQTIEDLLADLSIVGREMYRNTVDTLERKGAELDPAALTTLVIRLLRNVHTFNRLMDMFESGIDFMNDAAPIVKESMIDFINTMNELDRKGYFDFLRELTGVVDAIVTQVGADALRRLPEQIATVKRIADNLAEAGLLEHTERISAAVARIKPDESLDDRSLFQLFKEMRSPEVRRSMSYILRIVKAMDEKQNPINT